MKTVFSCILGATAIAFTVLPAAAQNSQGSFGSYINSQQTLDSRAGYAMRTPERRRAQAERVRERQHYRRAPGNFVEPFRDTSWDGYRYSNAARYW